MKKIINKPHLFFFSLIPLCLIIAYFLKSSGIEIAIYGGSFNISYWILFTFSSIFFTLIGINYFALNLINKPAKKWLTIIHIVLQVFSFILLFFYIYQTKKETTNYHQDILSVSLIVASFLFLVASFFHLINFFLSITSKKKN